ncbi:MAG: hypothetical protein NZ822_03305 [Patescibacteria group bacterium]|nr:hypothetical protein [Patescibacteria group bacterium]
MKQDQLFEYDYLESNLSESFNINTTLISILIKGLIIEIDKKYGREKVELVLNFLEENLKKKVDKIKGEGTPSIYNFDDLFNFYNDFFGELRNVIPDLDVILENVLNKIREINLTRIKQ